MTSMTPATVGMSWKRKLKVILTLSILFAAIIIIFSGNTAELQALVSENKRSNDVRQGTFTADTAERSGLAELKDDLIHMAIVVCNDRFEQSLVMIKSAVLFLKSKLVFHILTDAKLMKQFGLHFQTWPSEYMKKVSYHVHDTSFPGTKNSSEWRELWRPCAAERLFFPTLLPDVDALIYADTDIAFLSPVDDLWALFKRFSPTQLMAAAKAKEVPMLTKFSRLDPGEYAFRKIPYYGTTGLNSGVLLMNLTRLRNSTWKSDISLYQKLYGDKLLLGDQDLINIYFNFHPEQMFLLSCAWNYRTFLCRKDEYGGDCKSIAEEGIRAIHTNKYLLIHGYKKFTLDHVLEVVYDAMRKHDLRSNTMSDLLQSVSTVIDSANETEWQCKNLRPEFVKHIQMYIDSTKSS